MGLSCCTCHVQLSRTCFPKLSFDHFNQSFSANDRITLAVILVREPALLCVFGCAKYLGAGTRIALHVGVLWVRVELGAGWAWDVGLTDGGYFTGLAGILLLI